MNQTLPATAVAHVPAPPARRNRLLMDPVQFEHVQRVARVFAVSPLFPEHLRKGSNETAIANAILVINMADRLNEDELTVAQAIYFVGGKPGWSSSYLIAKANQHGVFRDVIDWEVKGTGDNLSVTAFGFLEKTGKRVAVTCDMKMARAEGWIKNPKYISMPEQMLRYRSATFLIRLYCPEVMVGVPAAIENELAMKDVTPDEGAYMASARASTPHNAETGEVIEAEAKPAAAAETAKPAAPKEEAKPAAKAATAEEAKPAEVEATKEEDEAPARDVLQTLCNTICTDLAESGMVDTVTDFYGEQIALLRKHAPDLAAIVDKTAAEIKGKATQGDLLGNR